MKNIVQNLSAITILLIINLSMHTHIKQYDLTYLLQFLISLVTFVANPICRTHSDFM